MTGWLATNVPYRPSPTWTANRPAASPAVAVALLNGFLLLSVGMWWAALGLATLPMGALAILFAVLAAFMAASGAPWLLVRKQMSGYLLLAQSLLIELWAWVTYVDHFPASDLIRDGLTSGLIVLAVEVAWLVAARRVTRHQPHTPLHSGRND